MVTWSAATASPRGQGAGLGGRDTVAPRTRQRGRRRRRAPLLERLPRAGSSIVGVQLARWGETTGDILSRRRGGLAVLRARAAGATTAGAGGVMAILAAHPDAPGWRDAGACGAGATGVVGLAQREEDVGAGRGAMTLGNADAPPPAVVPTGRLSPRRATISCPPSVHPAQRHSRERGAGDGGAGVGHP